MSIAQNFPEIKPSLDLSFALTKKLDPRVTFSRASSATYYGTETAKAEENLLPYSQEFDNAVWGKSNTSVTANTQTAPDGTTTAETLTATAGESFHVVIQTNAGITGTTRTFSLFAKKGTHDFVQLYFNADGAVFANFDLNAGTVGTVGSASTATITSVNSDWYRCVMTTSSITANNLAVIAMITSSTAVRAESWTAAGTETVFLWGAQLEQRSAVTAYTPTTDQPITRFQPVLESEPAGVARFDHDPVTGESLGLLVEEQRTNLLTYSEDFSDAGWTKVRSSIVANTIVAPDGTLTASKVLENTESQTHLLFKNATISNATVYTASIFLRAAERTSALVRFSGTMPSAFGVLVDLTDGTVQSSDYSLPDDYKIESVGNGWYKISITATSTGTSGGVQVRLYDGNAQSYQGDGFSGIFIWGASFEEGGFSTSYIKTEASQVTRAADAASMTGANFSSWYRQDEGSIYVEAQSPSVAGVYYYLVANSDTANEIRLASQSSGANPNYAVTVDNVIQASMLVTNPLGVPFISAFAYKTNSFNLATNGTLSTEDISGILPTATQLTIGMRSNGALHINGTIKKIAYYPQRLTNTQLQALTG